MHARHCTCMMRLVSQLLTQWFTSALLRMRRRTTSLKPLHRRQAAQKNTSTNKNKRKYKGRLANLLAAIVSGGNIDVVKLTSQPSSTSF